MQSRASGFEQVQICPYNNAHQILKHRMNTHLVKCRRQHPNDKTAQCIFNTTHIVPEPELAFHIDNCQDRILVDKVVYVPEDNPDHFPVVSKNVSAEEDWDDFDVPTYNPQDHCMQNAILRRVDTASHRVRKDHRVFECQRFQQIQQDTAIQRKYPGCRAPQTLSDSVVDSSRYLHEDDPADVAAKTAAQLEKIKIKQDDPVAIVDEDKPARPLHEIIESWTKVPGRKGAHKGTGTSSSTNPTATMDGVVKPIMTRLGRGRGRAINK